MSCMNDGSKPEKITAKDINKNMKDLFPEKHFQIKIIDGVRYMSEDYNNMLIEKTKQEAEAKILELPEVVRMCEQAREKILLQLKEERKKVVRLENRLENAKAKQKDVLNELECLKILILGQRRYLPSKESAGIMEYWIGDTKDNKGIYVDLGGVIGKIDKLKDKLSQEVFGGEK